LITINKIAFEKVIWGTSFYLLREIVNEASLSSLICLM